MRHNFYSRLAQVEHFFGMILTASMFVATIGLAIVLA